MSVSCVTAVHDAEQRKPASKTLPCLSVVWQLNVVTILTTHTDNWVKRLEFLSNQRGPIHWRDWTAYIFYSWQPASMVQKTDGLYSTADNQPARSEILVDCILQLTTRQHGPKDWWTVFYSWQPASMVQKTDGLYSTADNRASMVQKTDGLYSTADNQPARSEILVDCILQLTTQPERSGRLVDCILQMTTQRTRFERLVHFILQLTTSQQGLKYWQTVSYSWQPASKVWNTGGLYPIADNQPARSERLVDCIL